MGHTSEGGRYATLIFCDTLEHMNPVAQSGAVYTHC